MQIEFGTARFVSRAIWEEEVFANCGGVGGPQGCGPTTALLGHPPPHKSDRGPSIQEPCVLKTQAKSPKYASHAHTTRMALLKFRFFSMADTCQPLRAELLAAAHILRSAVPQPKRHADGAATNLASDF